jgi:hypothetical protein
VIWRATHKVDSPPTGLSWWLLPGPLGLAIVGAVMFVMARFVFRRATCSCTFRAVRSNDAGFGRTRYKFTNSEYATVFHELNAALNPRS